MFLYTCGEACGWACAFLSLFMFGSYSVPVKSNAAEKVDVDPLVFQTYRTFVSFAVAWSVLLLGVDFTFTPWGIVSGFCWVPGGISGIYAVRKAGLAISQGVWSCVIVMVSMSWGVFVFHENVKSIPAACCAALLLMAGLVGMSYYSSPKKQQKSFNTRLSYSLPYVGNGEESNKHASSGECKPLCPKDCKYPDDASEADSQSHQSHPDSPGGSSTTSSRVIRKSFRDVDSRDIVRYGSVRVHELPPESSQKLILVGNFGLTRYQLGVLAAINNGLLAGSILVPLKYAGSSNQGMQFVISQGVGAVTATITFWLLRYLYNVMTERSFAGGYNALPSFYFGEMWRPGCLAGSLWSIGNVSGIMAVTVLGLGIGQSVIQASMLISGLWGLFYYHEVSAGKDILLWLLSASVALVGVLWLSRVHKPI
mmetsp:Transcript_15780/g.34303  ORF Transcript_15780/g.34303 Transcript_15780/m.34303 type:complete len:424 (+) Transcript_15780:93-1364(+)